MADDIAARLAEAVSLQRAGDPRRALAIVEALHNEHPEDAGILNLRGGLLAQTGDKAGAVQSMERAVAINPALPYRRNLAMLLVSAGKDAAAEPHLRILCAASPDDPTVLLWLGSVLRRMRRYAEAEQFLRRHVALVPASKEGGNELGVTLEGLGRMGDAVAAFKATLAAAGPEPETYYNLGNALRDQHRPEDAIAAFDAAVQLAPEYAEAYVQRGFAKLLMGDFAGGWADYDWRWKIPGFGNRDSRAQQWRGQPLDGRRILVTLEQGFGDTFQFIRYAGLLADQGAEVMAACRPEQQDIVARARGVARASVVGEILPVADFQIPLLDLPKVLKTTLETVPAAVPYITADPARVAAWRGIIGESDKPAIGVFWRGSPDIRGKPGRTCPLAALAPLFENTAVRWFSLQKDRGNSEPLPAHVTDLGPRLTDWTETAAALTVLDGAVGIDTALIHLAGALARPALLMLSSAGDWRWLMNRADSPWYPTLRILRQPVPGDWRGAAELAAKRLPGGKGGGIFRPD